MLLVRMHALQNVRALRASGSAAVMSASICLPTCQRDVRRAVSVCGISIVQHTYVIWMCVRTMCIYDIECVS